MPTREELIKGFRLGDWEVLPSRGVLRAGDREESPEPLVFGLLLELALRDGELVSKEDLIDALWDGRPIGDEPIARAVSRLRGHLDDRKKPHRYVQTLQKRGYRLQEKVVLNGPPEAVADIDQKPARPPSIILRAIVVFLLMAMAAIVVWWGGIFPSPQSGVKSIGVLPFTNVSGDANNQYLVHGFKTGVIQALQPIPDVVIKTGRTAYPSKSATEIADILDVDSVLLGTVNRNGDELKVTYELVEASDSRTLAGGTVTGEVVDFFDLQTDVAAAVRRDLFGGRQQILVSASRPSNFDAYDSYLQGSYAFDRRGNGSNLETAMRLFEETIRMDPSFGPAYLQLATAYALLPAYRSKSLDESNRMAVSIVEQGIAADPSIEEASGAVFGFIYHSQKEWAKAELAYQQATNAIVVDSNAFNWYSRMLASVGRLDAALEQANLALELDPESAVITSRVALSYSWLGDADNAARYFERARRLGAEGATHLLGLALFLIREGKIEESREVAKFAADQGGLPPEWIDVVTAGIFDAELAAAALQAVNDTVAAGQMPPQIEVVARTMLNDLDGAMRVVQLLEQPGEAFEMDLLWIPEFAPLRQHPDFLDLMERLGIVEYWGLHGCRFEDAVVNCLGN